MSRNVSSESVQIIPLDEITSGAAIRFIFIDGVQYLSVRDLIMQMCVATVDYAGQIWRNIPETQKSEVRDLLSTFKFPGRGQVHQPVITFPGAIKLAMFLPGENAKKNRSMMANIIVRYFAGDPSLIKEIEANAMSDAPIPQMARTALLNDKDEGMNQVINDTTWSNLKRKREELELLKLETEIVVMTRKSQIEIVQAYTDMCTNTVIDEHSRNVFKDAMLSTMQSNGGGCGNNDKQARRILHDTTEKVQAAPRSYPPTFTYLESATWSHTNPLVEKYVNLNNMEPESDKHSIHAKRIYRIKELQHSFNIPNGILKTELKARILGFQYEGPRITSHALEMCKQVKEAYGIKREDKQYVILVMHRDNGVRPHRAWAVMYRLGLLARCYLLQMISFYKIGDDPIVDDVILDTIKQPAEDKWSWRAYTSPM
jgi:hypothetical protein